MSNLNGKHGLYLYFFKCLAWSGCVCVFVRMHSQTYACDWTWLLVSYLAQLCVCCKTLHEIFKVQWKLICWSEVSFFPSLSFYLTRSQHSCLEEGSKYHISVRWPSSGPCTTAAAQLWSSDQWDIVGDTMDHTHIVIRPSNWISHGCLDHYHGFHANWRR